MRTLTSLCVLSFLVNLGYGIVLPVRPTLAHATPVDVGFMYSIFSAAKLVALLIGGAAADRVGAERVLRWGVVAYAVSLAGLGWADSVSSVLVFRAVEGLAVGVVVPEWLRDVPGVADWYLPLFGAAVVLLMIWLPEGLLSLPDRIKAKKQAKEASAARMASAQAASKSGTSS